MIILIEFIQLPQMIYSFMMKTSLISLTMKLIGWLIAGHRSMSHLEGSFFTSCTLGDFRALKMGNDGLPKVVDIKTICLETNSGSKLILKEVRHVPDIRLHLISIGRLDDVGCCNIVNEGQWKLTKGSLVVARGKKCSSLYLLQASISTNLVNAVESNNMSRVMA